MVTAAMQQRRDAEAELNLPPGFRFHPTDEELVAHYLCARAAGRRPPVSIIAEVDMYRFDPWDLPERALFGRREWYFFTPRDRKYPNGSRPNRAAGSGYWKATGADKPVEHGGRTVGIKKALVFYHGKPPRGVKTEWIMHEYRLADAAAAGETHGVGGVALALALRHADARVGDRRRPVPGAGLAAGARRHHGSISSSPGRRRHPAQGGGGGLRRPWRRRLARRHQPRRPADARGRRLLWQHARLADGRQDGAGRRLPVLLRSSATATVYSSDFFRIQGNQTKKTTNSANIWL